MIHRKARALEEERHHQVADAAGASGCVGQIVRPGAHVIDEFRQGLYRHALVHDQGKRADRYHADREQVLLRIVRRLRHRGHDRNLRQRCLKQGVAVGGRPGHHVGRDGAVCPRLVLDDELSPQLGTEPLGHDASDAVRVATGRVGHDDRDRALRPRLSMGAGRCQRDCHGQDCYRQDSHEAQMPTVHGCLPHAA
jgi:hypothetical protein